MTELAEYRRIWKGESSAAAEKEYPGWFDSGFALLGDFSGIQSFVFRPIPGVRGAAKRLRSRSFRVSAYTELIARFCLQNLPTSSDPRLLYSAGGRFLIGAKQFDRWRETCESLQSRLDAWAWEQAEGELTFQLATAPFSGGRIPSAALHCELERRRNQPLGFVFRRDGSWHEGVFFRRAFPGEARCESCVATRLLVKDEDVCAPCQADVAIGKVLSHAHFARIFLGTTGPLHALGLSLELHQQIARSGGEWLSLGDTEVATRQWPILRQVPLSSTGDPLDFDEIARFSPGHRKFLAYARIDADHVGEKFRVLDGDPKSTWALSRFLHTFFGIRAGELLRQRFPHIYAVYGGGDDLFVIGPWLEVLEYVLELRRLLQSVAGAALTLSAGVHLAKPLDHVLSAADEAADELNKAKTDRAWARDTGRNQVRALGVTSAWDVFPKLQEEGKKASTWIEARLLPSSFLEQLLLLHNQWRNPHRPADRVRYQPLLRYQAVRNLRGEVREWAASVFREDSLWPWADFIARFALLASRRVGEGEVSDG